MARIGGRGALAREESASHLCTVAETLLDTVEELEKLYAMTGKLDNLTDMKLRDMKKRIERVVMDVC